jgi:hypothetical protein
VTFNHQKCGIKAGFKKVLGVSIKKYNFFLKLHKQACFLGKKNEFRLLEGY